MLNISILDMSLKIAKLILQTLFSGSLWVKYEWSPREQLVTMTISGLIYVPWLPCIRVDIHLAIFNIRCGGRLPGIWPCPVGHQLRQLLYDCRKPWACRKTFTIAPACCFSFILGARISSNITCLLSMSSIRIIETLRFNFLHHFWSPANPFFVFSHFTKVNEFI